MMGYLTPMSNTTTTPTKATATKSDTMPTGEWPGAWGIYKYSRDAVKFNLGVYLSLLVIPIIVAIVISTLKLPEALDNLLNNVISTVFGVASTFVILAALRRTKLDFNTSVKKSFSLLALEAFALQILTGFMIIGSLLLFVVPFFFVAPRLVLAYYYLIDKRLGIFGSISASWNETKGHVGKVYGIVGAGIAMGLLAVTIIGIPFAIYFLFMYSAALPVLYMYILKHPKSATDK